jgi:hypothetical protein
MEVEQMKKLQQWLESKRWNAGRAAAWVLVPLVAVGLAKEAGYSVAWMLLLMLIYSLVDICHYRGELAVLFYWCTYASGVGIAFGIGSCILGDWILGACCFVAACTVALQARRLWKEI